MTALDSGCLTDVAVVKLGGSLAYSPLLREWLSACRTSRKRLVIVPGGGPFADAVREVQARMGLSDSVAHRMALLAMAQFGEALASLEPGFSVAQGVEGLERALAEGYTPVWAPLELLAGAPGIDESWDVTSDSLAAWLASEIGAQRLILVKIAEPVAGGLSLAQMSDRGVVDRAFPAFVAQAGLDVIWLGIQDYPRLDAALQGRLPLASARPRDEPQLPLT